MDALRGNIASLSSHSNGNHVIQRCLQHMPDEYRIDVFEEVVKSCMEVAGSLPLIPDLHAPTRLLRRPALSRLRAEEVPRHAARRHRGTFRGAHLQPLRQLRHPGSSSAIVSRSTSSRRASPPSPNASRAASSERSPSSRARSTAPTSSRRSSPAPRPPCAARLSTKSPLRPISANSFMTRYLRRVAANLVCQLRDPEGAETRRQTAATTTAPSHPSL